MAMYSVGEPYSPHIARLPQGIHVINLSAERLEVVISLDHPTADEIANFTPSRSTIKVGVACHQELLILLFRQRGVVDDWSDAPFDVRLTPPAEQTPPPAARSLMTWVLVDSTTDIIRGLRLTSVSAQFMGAVRDCLARQVAQPFDRERYDALVEEYQERFTPRHLVKQAWRPARSPRQALENA